MKQAKDWSQIIHNALISPRTACFSLILSLASLCAAPSFAQACLMVSDMRGYGYFREADVILIADVASYTTVPERYHAVFELDTIRIIYGRVKKGPARWRVKWTNSTFGEPNEWNGSKSVIVGLRAEIDENGQPAIRILQEPCSSKPSLVSASKENLQAILRDSNISPAPARLKNIPRP